MQTTQMLWWSINQKMLQAYDFHVSIVFIFAKQSRHYKHDEKGIHLDGN